MQGKLFEYFVVMPLYVLLRGMRLLFLSCRTGTKLHGAIYYGVLKILVKNPEHARKMMVFERAIRGGKTIEWQRRLYTSHPRVVRHMLKNAFIRKLFWVSRRRNRLARQGHVIPTILMVSPTTPETGCNLACGTCYAMGHDSSSLPYDVFRKLMIEQEELGIYTVLISGGEPFLYKHLWRILREFPHTHFYVATNGTVLTERDVDELASLGNIYVMFSLEGFEERTDLVRGKGTFQKVLRAMKLCQERRLPFGVTATVTTENLAEVTSDKFLQMLDSYRCCGVSYSPYIPMGNSPRLEWQLKIRQSEHLDAVGEHVREHYAMLPTVGRGGLGRVSGCSAASEYFHVLPDGRVESCPFAQWANDMNIRDHSILEITSSPFFQGIRQFNRFGLAGRAPCEAVKSPALQEMFKILGAKQTVKGAQS